MLIRKDNLPANVFESCWRPEGIPLDYSLIVAGSLGRRLVTNLCLTVGEASVKVTYFNSHVFAPHSVAGFEAQCTFFF